ncbi:MAG: integrase [Haloarculaceae archaeon]
MPRYAHYDSLAEFAAFYDEEIAPAIRADPDLDVDPDRETPPYRWLKANYSGFVERLRRDFECSPGEFYDEVGIPVETDAGGGFSWGIDHEPTVTVLEEYVEELERDRGRAESTVSSRRSRLNTYVSTYRDVHGTGDLLSPLLDQDAKPDEIQRAKAVFRVLDDELGTLGSKRKYVSAVGNWYTFLQETGRAVYHPATNLLTRFGWDEEPLYDHPALSPADLEALLAAGDADERFLLLALAGWGLRPVEACELHVDQLVLEPPDGEGGIPYVEFAVGERKNARRTRNTVELLVGVDALRARIDRLRDRTDWSGYLLPSPAREGAPISTQTARRRLRDLGERAGVTVDGGPPKPKMGRRTWYRLYRQQRPDIEAGTAAVAASQGSRDAAVSERNYLDERTRREARAAAMRELVQDELAAIFDKSLPAHAG